MKNKIIDYGWIKIHRKICDWEWYNDSKMVHLFIHLLITANNKEGKWRGMKINKGQLVTGRKSLSVTTGISERSIRTCLERLKSTNEITIKTTNKYSIITILKYDDYQLSDWDADQQNDHLINQQTTNNRPQTIMNNNEDNKKRKDIPKISDELEPKKKVTSKEFYENELTKCNGDIGYRTTVEMILGKNELKRPMEAIMKTFRDQLSYEQFNALSAYRLEVEKKGHKFTVMGMLKKIENWGNKSKNASVYLTLRNWVDRDMKQKRK